MRYLAKISYDGSKFFGFQRLEDHKTVQEEVERVLSIINKSVVKVSGAGRTDRGVHALGQGISFDLNVNIPPENLKEAMNALLDKSVYVKEVLVKDNFFHARFDAVMKTYEYVINVGEYDAIYNDYVYNYGYPLDIMKMKAASKYLVGAHSFRAFTSGERKNYNSIISSVKLRKKADRIYITFKGKSFYRYMVRNMVGALIYVGCGKGDAAIIKEMIDSDKKKFNYLTVPANGLCLIDVKY